MAYASNTDVSSDRSRAEIERTLSRYGADEFAYATRRDMAVIQFAAEGRTIRFTVPLPDRESHDFTHTPVRGTRRSPAQIEAAYEQAVRQRWRALALVVKAKLEAVESGIVTFEQEFLPHILVPGQNGTVYDQVRPALAVAYETGRPAVLLLEGGAS